MSDRGKKLRPKDLRRTTRGEQTTGRARVRRTRKEVSRENKPMDEARVRTTERRPDYRSDGRAPYRGDQSRRGGVPWWAWLLGLLAIGVALFMVFAGGDSGDGEAGSAGAGSEATGDSSGAGGTAAEGTLSAGGTDLLPIASSGGELGQYEGESIDGRSVAVESVVSDEGFWVGNGPQERVFVHLDLEGESGPEVDAGDRVDLSGTMTAAPEGFAGALGVTDEEGAGQLDQQGSYIEATQIEEAA